LVSCTKKEHGLSIFEKRVLRRTYRPEREEVVGGWRRLHNKELHNWYTSPNIIKVIKSRSKRWAEYIAHMGNIMRNPAADSCEQDSVPLGSIKDK
jgi:hypothetical protein